MNSGDGIKEYGSSTLQYIEFPGQKVGRGEDNDPVDRRKDPYRQSAFSGQRGEAWLESNGVQKEQEGSNKNVCDKSAFLRGGVKKNKGKKINRSKSTRLYFYLKEGWRVASWWITIEDEEEEEEEEA